MRKRTSAIVALGAIVAALPLGAVVGQQLVVGGHALDQNLRLGSGGYNRRVPNSNYMVGRRYYPGQSKPLYVLNQEGELQYSPNNAFFPKTQYRAVGYQATYQTPGYNRRFRYHDQY